MSRENIKISKYFCIRPAGKTILRSQNNKIPPDWVFLRYQYDPSIDFYRLILVLSFIGSYCVLIAVMSSRFVLERNMYIRRFSIGRGWAEGGHYMTSTRISRVWGTILLAITICSISLPSYAKYSGGIGEPNEPYQIATAEDLMLLGETPEDYDKHFILTGDIDLDPNLPGRKVFDKAVIAPNPTDVTGGSYITAFTGVFDGNNHTISHLTIDGESHIGLFGILWDGASISNLGLNAVDVNGDDRHVGGLVGYITKWSREGTTVTNCYSTGSVTGGENVGGLIGFIGFPGDWIREVIIVANCYSTCAVTGGENAGGLVGYNSGSIMMCYSIGAVTGNNGVGGLVGEEFGRITASFWDVETSGQATSAGGTGLTTSEMQDINTYLREGWDFVDEVFNGTCDYWQISPGDYPQLHYKSNENRRMPEGLGTAEQPYLIRDANDLGTIWLKPMAHYHLETSVDLSGITWSMPVVPCFGGTFEGNGHVISYLHIQGGGQLGLFGRLGRLGFGARISNIGLEEVDIRGTGDYVGGLVGYTGDSRDATDRIVVNCYSTGSVSGNDYVGGLVGFSSPGTSITSCDSAGAVNGDRYIGGLVGKNHGAITSSAGTGPVTGQKYVGGLLAFNDEATITSSYSTGDVSGYGLVGGLVGSARGDITNSYSTGTVNGDWNVGGLVGDNDGSITSCYSTGSVSGDNDVGGLVGWNAGTITLSSSTGIVNGDSSRVGGLVGWNYGAITLSSSTCEVSGNKDVGGLVGFNRNGTIMSSSSTGTVSGDKTIGGFVGWNNKGTITSCYNTGAVTGNNEVGGLVGKNYSAGASITSCYSTGAVIGNNEVGGLVGINTAGTNITSCYSTGAVTGHDEVGGLVGRNYKGTITSSLWDTETSAQTTSAGGTGATTAEMQTATTFLSADWDFLGEVENGTDDIWWINEGQDYPRLWWELIP